VQKAGYFFHEIEGVGFCHWMAFKDDLEGEPMIGPPIE